MATSGQTRTAVRRSGTDRATKRQKVLAWFLVGLMVFSVLAGLGSMLTAP